MNQPKETNCKCKDSFWWTEVKCRNLCGKAVEPFWHNPEPRLVYYREALEKILIYGDDKSKYLANRALNHFKTKKDSD